MKIIVKDQNFPEGKFGFHPKATKNFVFPEYSQGALRGNFSVLDYKNNFLTFKFFELKGVI